MSTLLLVVLANVVGVPLPDGSPSIAIAVVADEPIRTSIRNEIAARLRSSGRAGGIGSDEFPSLIKLNDQAIVGLAKGVDVVITARARDDGRIVLTYYDREGRPLGTVAITVSAVPAKAVATMPIPAKEVTQADIETREATELAVDLQPEYLRVRLARMHSEHYRRGNVELTPRQFFEALNLPAMAKAIEVRRKLRLGLALAGGLSVAVGILTLGAGHAYWGLTHFCFGDVKDCTVPPVPLSIDVPGGVLLGLGVVSFVTGLALSNLHPREAEIDKMIGEHNRKLRDRFKVAPTVGQNTVGVLVGGRF